MRMSSGQLSSSLPPPPTSRYASAWSNALKARLPVQLGGWSGAEATERLTQASKDKASLGRPQFQLLHHLHLAAITLFRKDKRKFLLKKAYNSATSKLIFSTCKYFCTYIHTWTHTDIQNPFFSWQKALSEARVGPWTRLWFSKVWLTICSLLLMPPFFSLSHPEESHCLIPILWQV